MKRYVLVIIYLMLGPFLLHADELSNAKKNLLPISLETWEYVTAKPASIARVCKTGEDGVISITGKPIGYLTTRVSYQSYKLHFEWRWPQDAKTSNGGVLIHISSSPTPGTPWPVCLQIQLKMHHAGDLLPMATAHFTEALSTAAGAKTPLLQKKAPSNEVTPGDWNAADIICQDNKVTVKINGLLQNEVTDCNPSAGKIGFQLEGAPFDLRNIWIVRLNEAKAKMMSN